MISKKLKDLWEYIKLTFRGIKNRIKYGIYSPLKDRQQRYIRGYADVDVWNLDLWFLELMPKMLKQLRDNAHGYPPNSTPEKWEKILTEMIECFTEANEETCSKKNPIDIMEVDDTNRAQWWEYEKEIGEYRLAKQERGLKLFTKWFNDLWD